MNTAWKQHRASQTGLSLIELMVAMLLGILLTAGIVSVYLESKRNFAADEELARVQENGRFALTRLKQELTLAGFFAGYLDYSTVAVGGDSVTGCGSTWALDLDTPVDFVNNVSSSLVAVSGDTLPCLDLSEIKSGTDIVTVKRTAGEATDNYIQRGNLATPQDNQFYLKIQDFGDDRNWVYHTSGSFSAADPNETEHWEMHARMFYIRNYSTEAGDGIPTLCVRELAGDSMQERCLVEGVEDMQVAFGIDTDADNIPNRYDMNPSSLAGAVTARVYLLLRSLDEPPDTSNFSSKSFQLGMDPNTTTTTTDRHLRRIFSTTVQMRNAVLPSAT